MKNHQIYKICGTCKHSRWFQPNEKLPYFIECVKKQTQKERCKEYAEVNTVTANVIKDTYNKFQYQGRLE